MDTLKQNEDKEALKKEIMAEVRHEDSIIKGEIALKKFVTILRIILILGLLPLIFLLIGGGTEFLDIGTLIGYLPLIIPLLLIRGIKTGSTIALYGLYITIATIVVLAFFSEGGIYLAVIRTVLWTPIIYFLLFNKDFKAYFERQKNTAK
ncbi:MAG: hypothetical protein EAZ97_15990 [Bacteroidetes bacterium]|nr:MAG: hypothetical protein EAZ97_15990 [Bacteroidota bacterium]